MRLQNIIIKRKEKEKTKNITKTSWYKKNESFAYNLQTIILYSTKKCDTAS